MPAINTAVVKLWAIKPKHFKISFQDGLEKKIFRPTPGIKRLFSLCLSISLSESMTHVPVPFVIKKIIIMIIMQINTRTACTTTRRTVVKRGNAAAVWSSSNTSSTVSRPRSPTTRRRPTCSYYSLLSAVSSTRGGATSPQRLSSTWRTGWRGSEAPSRGCNTRETRSKRLWTLDQLLSHQRRLEHQPQPLGETRSFQSRCTRASARSRSTGRTASPHFLIMIIIYII